MSFYASPFIITPQSQQPRARRVPPTHVARTPVSLADLEDEERTALAYLHSVQRRREAAEAAAALEAKQRAAAAAKHEAAVRAAAEQQAQLHAAARRERAVREALVREREREAALAQAIEQRRREALAQAIEQERTRQAAAARAYEAALEQYVAQQQAARQAAQRQHAQRQQAQRAAQQQALREAHAVQVEAQAQAQAKAQAQALAQAQAQAQAACAKSSCCRRAAPTKDTDDDDLEDDLAGINSLLGSLFGFRVAKEDLAALRAEQELPENTTEKTAETPAPAAAETKAEVPDKVTRDLEAFAAAAETVDSKAEATEKRAPAAAPANETTTAETETSAADDADPADVPLNPEAKEFVPSQPAPAPAASEPVSAEAELPPELNQLLNAFLGLQVDPAAEGEQAAGGAGKVVGDAVVNLNDILARYGLEFVPDEVEIHETPEEESKTEAQPETDTRDVPAAPEVEAVETKEATPAAPEPTAAAETPAAPVETAKTETAATETETPGAAEEPAPEPVAAAPAPEPVAKETSATKSPVAEKKEITPAPELSNPIVNKVEVPSLPELSSAPFTSTLDHHSNIPPYLRDILANVETAMNALDEDEDKPCEDNCVCDNETKDKCNSDAPCAQPCNATSAKKRNWKKRRAAAREARKAQAQAKAQDNQSPTDDEITPERAAAFEKLDSIDKELHKLTSEFTFPPHLGFAASTPDRTQPPLLFNRHNSPYHAQAHALLQLILQCDGVQSDGDRVIRRKRKELVGKIERALGELEARRDARWEEVRERRERGESDDEDDIESSATDTEHEVEGFELI